MISIRFWEVAWALQSFAHETVRFDPAFLAALSTFYLEIEMKLFSKLTTAAGITLALVAGSASAAPINGSIGLSDGLSSLTYSLSPTAIVNSTNGVFFAGPGNTSSSTGDFMGSDGMANVTVTDITSLVGPLDAGVKWQVNGFSFNLTSLTFGPANFPPFSCGAATCNDGLVMSVLGVVSHAGFDDTQFTGTFSLSGSCVKAVGSATCTRTSKSATWSAALSAAGEPVVTPEPVSISMLGLGLLAAGAVARRKRVAA